MKKLLFLCALSLLSASYTFGQQKIKDGSSSSQNLPNKDALLELESLSKGFLNVRLELKAVSDPAPLSKHTAGMMVYNTATNGNVRPGLYYNDGTRWVLLETSGGHADIITTLVNNEDGTYTYTSEDGTQTVIDIPADVINQFETILNDQSVRNAITNLVKQTGGNVYYDGNTFTYITETGTIETITIRDIVQANETVTTLVNNGDGTYTYTNEKGDAVTIDVPADVVNNFQDIITNTTVLDQLVQNLTNTTVGGNVSYDGDKFTYVDNNNVVQNITFKDIVQGNESETVIITIDGKQYYVSEAYLAANEGIVPSTVDPTALPAGIYAIDVVGGVVNNFEEIVQNGPIEVDGRTFPTINDYITYLTESTGGFTKIIYDQSTGDVIFQEWDDSSQTWVNVDNSKFETIVQSNESKTEIITVNDKQYYVSEAYLIANGGIVPSTVDPTALPAGIYAIDVVGGVVNNFEEIVQNGPIEVDGRTFPTINDYITYLTESTGGFTKIIYDQSTGDVIFQEWDDSTNTWVNVDNSKFETIVQSNESKTEIITVNDKQYYVSEAYLIANGGIVPSTVDPTALPAGIYAIDVVGGVVNNFEEIVQNGPIEVDGRTFPTINDYITYLTESTGGFTKIIYDQSTGDVIFQEWDDSTNTWVNVDNSKFETIVKANETVTTLKDNGNGTFTYYNESDYAADGTLKPGAQGIVFDANTLTITETDGVYTFTDAKGTELAKIDRNAGAI
ncbi:hypothetical protein ORI89_12885, partial [Sphingobacterium sp. UT-1RO-CII-1]|uniref:hypothetical protein n=1 Tax=Sphingobacterium sp. UT-1RO-CII-1 TaxID=2995225 RepID=UPI00227C4044